MKVEMVIFCSFHMEKPAEKLAYVNAVDKITGLYHSWE